jgi:hypothetical protein
MSSVQPELVAFLGDRRVAAGDAHAVSRALRDLAAELPVLVFDTATGRRFDVDAGGAVHIPAPPADLAERRGPGRPKLGVVAREVTLLPRHWDWLAGQPGGASVALRRLVEAASRSGDDRRRAAKDAAYRFMLDTSGDRPGYEEALRALYAGDGPRFDKLVARWPEDIRDQTARFAEVAFVREPKSG